MGNAIRIVFSNAIRPIRNINIEKRAHKFISKEKPTPAPQYESTSRQIEVSKSIDPEFMERQKIKDPTLNKYLKDIYVKSTDPDTKDSSVKEDPLKPLPTSRKTFEFEDFNYYYVNNIKEGKCSLQHFQTFLSKNAENRKTYTADIIAEQYNLDKKVVENILKYYSIFRIEVNKKTKKPSSMALFEIPSESKK
ncbi:protein NDUFAF4 homolog isoform X2 [Leptopilina heterotoma]|uniref:protein NDUFAF4 homolog isoform X2 n=1 Tax=Leptopilina heterotoma TaxID=63436 RepID=UPI001CA7C7F0|nr:protein NDUFAF4 homolog isoform X2 [Leptopilina heterotoma]